MFSNLFQRVLFGETKGLQVESLEVEADQIEVVAVSILSEAQCPVCGQRNSRVQSHSVRCVTDGGWRGMSVRIKREVRRFYGD